MCRSSAKSIGFLLLLWMGIFTPVAEYQISNLAGSASLSDLLDGAFGGAGEHDDTLAQADDAASYASSPANADLSDFLLAVAHPHITALQNPLEVHRVAEGFASRDLPPRERPPNNSAA